MRWVIILLLANPSFGAFRVYRLRLIHYDAFGNFARNETVLSTLDHIQYEHYHGGYRWTRVELIDHWYCPGDTSRKLYCEPPRVKNRVPASLERGKRFELPYNRQPIIP